MSILRLIKHIGIIFAIFKDTMATHPCRSKQKKEIKAEKSSEFFLNIASLCGLVTVAIAIGIIATCDKYLLKSKYQI